ncbi:hypothetical protein F5890DRAFT_1552674 [Lentinula detonsa]|uniref:Thioesterase domain-containing protein n=1 Tax=Lentinula detonsa TaxID=2804962 RepID=A0AA38Q297_9AGAR|nr:hypothetical protein F5890DRAFT_1552674 [Lentinula detonsa]
MQDPATVSGNASDDIKQFLVDPLLSFNTLIEGKYRTTFADGVVNRITIDEASLSQQGHSHSKEARVICSIRVAEDMIDGAGILHGGCSALLVDLCSTLAMAALQMYITGKPVVTVSQAMNVVFHAPADLGEDLRIINTSVTTGKRIVSAKTEIWSVTHRRLLVSGVHVKMTPTRKPRAVVTSKL